MIQKAELFMSKIGFRGLVSLMGLVMVVCLAVLQMKSLADLHELGLTVATMKRKDEYNVEKDLDKTGGGGKMSSDAVYGQDIERLRVALYTRGGEEQDALTILIQKWFIQVLSLSATLAIACANMDVDEHSRRKSVGIFVNTNITCITVKPTTKLLKAAKTACIAAGSWYENTGAAVNTLCLPHEPIWGTYTDGLENFAFIYGAEYHDHTLFKLTNAEGLLYHNMPCVVCRSRLRTSTFMLPSRNRCFGDWHVEYHGYLMTGHNAHAASTDYICVDEAPEADPSGFRIEHGRLLNRVEAICGSLPCPKYMNRRELTCAICSK